MIGIAKGKTCGSLGEKTSDMHKPVYERALPKIMAGIEEQFMHEGSRWLTWRG